MTIKALSSKFEIAIIGFGAAGLSFLINLLEKYAVRQFPMQITIYDKKERYARGNAYQQDSEYIYLNRYYEDMSIYPNDIYSFKRWADAHFPELVLKYNGYLPRSLFGQYMQQIYAQLTKQYSALIKEKFVLAEKISPGHKKNYLVISEIGDAHEYDAVILAIGHPEPENIYNLSGNYINNPYPTLKLANIPHDRTVGIIGSGLTAVDAALTLVHNQHRNAILVFSRSGYMYSKKEMLMEYPLRYFTEEAIQTEIIKKDKKLKETARMLFKEFKAAGITSIREVYYTDKYSCSIEPQKLQSLVFKSSLNFEAIWPMLSIEEKRLFFKVLFKYWIKQRSNLAPNNHDKFTAAIRAGKISVLKNLSTIRQSGSKFTFVANNHTFKTDYVINATGYPRDLKNQNIKIIESLVSNNLVTYDEFGGILVSSKSNETIQPNGTTNKYLYALGHITCGSYLFTSYITHVTASAKKINEHLFKNFIMEKLNDCSTYDVC